MTITEGEMMHNRCDSTVSPSEVEDTWLGPSAQKQNERNVTSRRLRSGDERTGH